MSSLKVRMWPLSSDVNSNPYISLILSKQVEYIKHDWSSSLNTDFDIFHMHWPETYINSEKILVRLLGSFVVLFYLFFLKVIGKKIVWTVHNVKPHDNSIVGTRLFYKLLVYLTDKFIFMSEVSFDKFSSSFPNVVKHYVLIPHPLYPSSEYDGVYLPKKSNNQLLFFGLIRKYKNVELLVSEFKKIVDVSKNLYILGFCESVGLKESLLSLCKNDIRIHLDFVRYSESYLDSVLKASNGVVIPYGNMVNSGILFKCISEGAYILLPDDPYNREVIDYFGYQNFMFYENELKSDDISEFFGFISNSTSSQRLDVGTHNEMVVNSHFETYNSFNIYSV